MVVELDADASLLSALGLLGRDPDDFARDGNAGGIVRQAQQHEHLVAEYEGSRRRNEQPAVVDEWHVGRLQDAGVFERHREQPLRTGFAFNVHGMGFPPGNP